MLGWRVVLSFLHCCILENLLYFYDLVNILSMDHLAPEWIKWLLDKFIYEETLLSVPFVCQDTCHGLQTLLYCPSASASATMETLWVHMSAGLLQRNQLVISLWHLKMRNTQYVGVTKVGSSIIHSIPWQARWVIILLWIHEGHPYMIL